MRSLSLYLVLSLYLTGQVMAAGSNQGFICKSEILYTTSSSGSSGAVTMFADANTCQVAVNKSN